MFYTFFITQAFVQGAKCKKLLIDWNQYQKNIVSIGFQFCSRNLSLERSFTLFQIMPDYVKSTLQNKLHIISKLVL